MLVKGAPEILCCACTVLCDWCSHETFHMLCMYCSMWLMLSWNIPYVVHVLFHVLSWNIPYVVHVLFHVLSWNIQYVVHVLFHVTYAFMRHSICSACTVPCDLCFHETLHMLCMYCTMWLMPSWDIPYVVHVLIDACVYTEWYGHAINDKSFHFL